MRDFQNAHSNDGYTKFDKEYACWANNHNGWRKAKKKSRRIVRGLFKSNSGLLINSDVNGSLQIMKKVFPNAFEIRYGIEGVLTPIVINAAKVA